MVLQFQQIKPLSIKVEEQAELGLLLVFKNVHDSDVRGQ